MREQDRMRLLVCDAVDTMSRMSDKVLADTAKGIHEHMEEVFLAAEGREVEDVVTSTLVVALAILKPCLEQMLAQTSDRQYRGRRKQEVMCYNEDDESI